MARPERSTDQEPHVETTGQPGQRGQHAEPVARDEGRGSPTAEQERPVFTGTGIYAGFVALIIIGIALVIFAAQNTESVPVQFTVWEFEAPLIVVVLITAIAAALVTELVGAMWRHNRRRVRTERQELQRLRQERRAQRTAEQT